jgi:hypothetical protein
MSNQLNILKILTKWTERTDTILRLERKKAGIGETGALERSQQTAVMQKSEAVLESQLEFLIRGRFVDMGVGRGRSLESMRTNKALLSGRKRKKKMWYSRAYYARINDLQGVLGYQLMESAIRSIKDPLDNV